MRRRVLLIAVGILALLILTATLKAAGGHVPYVEHPPCPDGPLSVEEWVTLCADRLGWGP